MELLDCPVLIIYCNRGHHIIILDKSDMLDGCSYGNADYICPSHFVPMATPGIVKQGFKMDGKFKESFLCTTSMSMSLVNWGFKFIKAATKKHIENSAVPLRDIALLSKSLYEDLIGRPGFDFCYEKKGLLDVFKREVNAHHG